MLVEIFRLPSGWQQFEVSDVDSPVAMTAGDAAYWVVRSQHPELTDDNHTYEAERVHEIVEDGKVHRWRQVSVFRKPASAMMLGATGAYLFGVKYREVT